MVENLKIKEKPEDFIVGEVAEHEINQEGRFYLYKLIKRNLNTLDVCKKYNLSYAGLKDKNALTFQYVSSDKFLGNFIRNKQNNSFYFLQFIGKTNKKIKIGMLKGNLFNIKINFPIVKNPNYFINYYDTQRIKKFNIEKGKKLFFSDKKKFSRKENFFVDSYLSYLWNKSLEMYLKEKFNGKYIKENEQLFFIPIEFSHSDIQKFWPILGYKVKLSSEEKFYYEKVLEIENISTEKFLEKLKEKRIKGDYRRTFEKVENFKTYSNYISFYLNKGAYATMLLKFLYTENVVFKP